MFRQKGLMHVIQVEVSQECANRICSGEHCRTDMDRQIALPLQRLIKT